MRVPSNMMKIKKITELVPGDVIAGGFAVLKVVPVRSDIVMIFFMRDSAVHAYVSRCDFRVYSDSEC